VKQLAEDDGRLNIVLFSRGKASIRRQSSLELRKASHMTRQDHARNMSIALVPENEDEGAPPRCTENVCFQSSVIVLYGTGGIAILPVLRGQRRSGVE